MGKRMDMAALLAMVFIAMFALLLFTGRDVRIIAVLSAVSALCAGVVGKSIHKKAKANVFRRKRNLASKWTKGLIYKENKDALYEASELLAKKYSIHSIVLEGGHMYFKEGMSEDEYELFIIRKYKSSPDDILSVWRETKKGKPVKGILFLIPGKMDQDIKLLRYKIDQPGILILDSNALKTLYRKYGQIEQTAFKEKSVRPIHFLKSAVNKKRAFRYFAYALLLTGYYLLSGNWLYLSIGALLTFMSLFSFFSNVNSDQLFF